jgi:hypothetical protein
MSELPDDAHGDGLEPLGPATEWWWDRQRTIGVRAGIVDVHDAMPLLVHRRLDHDGFVTDEWTYVPGPVSGAFDQPCLHRYGGPALLQTVPGGAHRERWYRYGRLHRDDGPAVVDLGVDYAEERQWWRRGRRFRADGGPVIVAVSRRGTVEQSWYDDHDERDHLNRVAGPALIARLEDGAEVEVFYRTGVITTDPLSAVEREPAVVVRKPDGTRVESFFRGGYPAQSPSTPHRRYWQPDGSGPYPVPMHFEDLVARRGVDDPLLYRVADGVAYVVALLELSDDGLPFWTEPGGAEAPLDPPVHRERPPWLPLGSPDPSLVLRDVLTGDVTLQDDPVRLRAALHGRLADAPEPVDWLVAVVTTDVVGSVRSMTQPLQPGWELSAMEPLERRAGFPPSVARWAVRAWAYALGMLPAPPVTDDVPPEPA